MTVINPYKKSSHLSMWKTRRIIKCFSDDFNATQTSNLLWIRRATINSRYNYFRQAIMWNCLATDKEIRKWIIEINESYFWPKRIRWKRWRWAWGKTKVLWLLKRYWKVFVYIVPDCSAQSLIPIARWKVNPWSTMNIDWWKVYDGLVDLWYEKYYRVHHWKNQFARWKNILIE